MTILVYTWYCHLTLYCQIFVIFRHISVVPVSLKDMVVTTCTYIVFIMSLFTSMCIKRTDCSSTFYQLGLWYVGNKCINDWWIYLDISCLWQNSDTLCDLPVRKRLVFYTSNRFAKRVRFKSLRFSSMSVNSS